MRADNLDAILRDKRGITYRTRWCDFTGSPEATILLQQILFRWNSNARSPFYKFTAPCKHPLYVVGDSWVEELGFTRHRFEKARKAIAKRTNSLEPIDNTCLVTYWVDSNHKTWHWVNEPLVLRRHKEVYPVVVKPPMPGPEQRDDSSVALLQDVGVVRPGLLNVVAVHAPELVQAVIWQAQSDGQTRKSVAGRVVMALSSEPPMRPPEAYVEVARKWLSWDVVARRVFIEAFWTPISLDDYLVECGFSEVAIGVIKRIHKCGGFSND